MRWNSVEIPRASPSPQWGTCQIAKSPPLRERQLPRRCRPDSARSRAEKRTSWLSPCLKRRMAASPRPKCTGSQPAPDEGAGCALAHAVIEGLRLCVGRDAEEARQQLAAAPVGLQRLAVISELLVAEHQAPIQTLVERVELDPESIQIRSILPTARVLALTRRIADGAQQTITQFLAHLQNPGLFGLVLEKMSLIEESETADPFDVIRRQIMRALQLLLELPHVDPQLIPVQAHLSALHA